MTEISPGQNGTVQPLDTAQGPEGPTVLFALFLCFLLNQSVLSYWCSNAATLFSPAASGRMTIPCFSENCPWLCRERFGLGELRSPKGGVFCGTSTFRKNGGLESPEFSPSCVRSGLPSTCSGTCAQAKDACCRKKSSGMTASASLDPSAVFYRCCYRCRCCCCRRRRCRRCMYSLYCNPCSAGMETRFN